MADKNKILMAVMPVPDGFAQFGSLPPILKAGEIANKRGYEVIWSCCECLHDVFSRNFPDNEVFTYQDPTLYGLPKVFQKPFMKMMNMDLPQWMMAQLMKEQNSEWLFDSFVTIGFGKQRFFEKAVLEVLKVILTKRVDRMLCYADPIGLVAAHLAGIPVMAFDNLMPVTEAGGKGAEQFNKTVSATIRKFSPRAEDVRKFSEIYRNDRQFRMISSIKYVGEDTGCETELYVGGFEPVQTSVKKDAHPINENELQNQRIVFAYFGTASISFNSVKKALPHAFEIINQNNNGKPWHCYVGSQFAKSAYDEGTVHFAPFYDSATLFKYAEMTLTHGGINTLYESLTYGVPLLIVPGSIYERRFNAQEVVATGSGVVMEINDFTPENVASVFMNETKRKAMAENALAVKNRINKSGGIEKAFDIAEVSWNQKADHEKVVLVEDYLKKQGFLA